MELSSGAIKSLLLHFQQLQLTVMMEGHDRGEKHKGEEGKKKAKEKPTRFQELVAPPREAPRVPLKGSTQAHSHRAH